MSRRVSRRFLCYVFGQEDAGTYIGSLDSKPGKRIGAGSSSVFVAPSWLLYVRGSTLVAQSFDPDKASFSGDPIHIAEQVAIAGPGVGACSASQNDVLAYRRALPPSAKDLTWYDRTGKKLGTVGEQAVYSNPALSPGGRRLAVSRGRWRRADCLGALGINSIAVTSTDSILFRSVGCQE